MKSIGGKLVVVSLIFLVSVERSSKTDGQRARVCPRGWLYVSDQCWKYMTGPRSWDGARSQCQSQRSDLASIHSEEENRFIYSLMLKYGTNSSIRRPVMFHRRRLAQPVDLSCFQLTRNAVLVGFAQVASEIPTVEECQSECLNAEQVYSFKCLSIMYYPQTNDCILNSENRLTEPTLFNTETFGERVDYYDNFCDTDGPRPTQPTAPPPPPTPTPPPPTPPPTFPPVQPIRQGCFEVYRNTVLVGYADQVIDTISSEQCEQECLNAQSRHRLDCRSFVYYNTHQVCILNQATKTDYPNLFGPEQGADYYEKLPGDCSGTEPTTGCPTQDVLFIIDGSGSIGPQSFENIRKFLTLVTSELDIGFNRTNIGVIQFNEQPHTEFPLRSFQSKQGIHQAIQGIQWRNGRTLIGRALQYALDKELLRTQGDRVSVPNVVITLTDGLSQDNPLPPAEDMRTLGMDTYAIGVTDAVFDEQLLNIAGDPNRVFKVQDFSRLDGRLKDALIQLICKPGPLPPLSTPGPPLPPHGVDGAWIGLKDQLNQGNFQWSDRSPLDYRNWKFGQPHRRTGENCVVAELEPLVRWSNINCDSNRQYVCKQRPTVALNDFIKTRRAHKGL